MALEEIKLPRLPSGVPIAEANLSANTTFAVWWNSVCNQLESSVNGVIEAQNAADAAAVAATAAQGTADGAVTDAATAQTTATAAQTTANTGVTAAAAAQATATSALTVANAAIPKNQTPAPSYTAYTGQTISNPPTQAQVQALDSAVVTLSAMMVTVIGKLHTINAFS